MKRKRLAWKRTILHALEAAKKKLSHYYGKTYHERGDIYSTGAILSPEFKLSIFEGATWEKEWKNKYKDRFEDLYYDNYDSNASSSAAPRYPTTTSTVDSLSLIIRHQKKERISLRDDMSKVTAYLSESGV